MGATSSSRAFMEVASGGAAGAAGGVGTGGTPAMSGESEGADAWGASSAAAADARTRRARATTASVRCAFLWVMGARCRIRGSHAMHMPLEKVLPLENLAAYDPARP